MAAEPQLQRRVDADGSVRIELLGSWDLSNLQPQLASVAASIDGFAREAGSQWDLRQIERLDDVGALLLWRGWGRRAPALLTGPGQAAWFADLAAVADAGPAPVLRLPRGWVQALGERVRGAAHQLLQMLLLVGQVALDSIAVLRRPASTPWREISANIFRTGTQALSITALVGFLVGVVLSYLSAQQLQAYGANIFIIKILGIGVVRELGPLLAAILVAGRSGSSMTAQLGVMRVTQELDALAVMGISISGRLVMPKVLALALTLPLLVLWTDAIALIGGMLAANWQLGINYRQFLHELPFSVGISNLWLGVGKGSVFGFLIAVVACHYGLQIKPNSESLGRGTTESVVTAITVVIVVDALFAMIFANVGL